LVDLLPLAVLLVLTGLLAGGVAGLLGVGGGIVIVPVLFHVFTELGIDPAVRMHLAVGTSLATIVVTAWRSSRSHHARGAVDVALLRAWIGPVLLGVLLGSATARYASGPALSAVFATVALCVAVHLAFSRESWRIADGLPRGPGRVALGSGIGFFSVLMGLGGGTLGVPIGVPGAISFAASGWDVPGLPQGSLGYVNLLGFALIVPATWLSAPWGARLAHVAPQRTLRRAFALFLALTSLRMFIGLT
jgi:uncharacterized membrane protein YfcA